MKILTLHVDYINFKPLKKALKSVSDLSEQEKKEQKVSEALVVLTAVEKGDSVQASVSELVKNVKDVASQVKAKNIVLYPYAHLSSNLASPNIAVEILEKAEKELSKDFKVTKAPFGYYKEFELKVKGHPLSELSRSFGSLATIKEEKKSRQIEKSEDYDPKKLLNEISKSKLDSSKLKDNDHRILGQQMDLFSFSEVAPGMVFWHNNGLIIRNELVEFWRELQRNRGYKEISTPQIMDAKLWKISGHWEKYKENIFLSNYENKDFAVKPMNCPGGMVVYRSSPKSYKELPLRVAELGIVHRQELSGVLGGLFRVVQFTQDDAHIFCTEDQLEEEIKGIIELDDAIYSKFDFEYSLELSTRPEKRIGTDKQWTAAEKILEKVLKKSKMKFKVNKGDGAFYGPKIDFHLKDSLGRTWQCGTIQLDFSMPERFELEYVDKDNKKKRPVMLHRTLYGSLERFIGILLEHTNGRLPAWLAPVQIRVLSFTDRNVKYAKKTIKKLAESIPGLRIDADFRAVPVNSKIREAELMRIPFVILIGDKEQEKNTLAVRHEGKVKYDVKADGFIKEIKELIEERK
ncbi:threonine--tRNA ligase [Candidatus Pacearchaeota archaeon]|nr:threonine--tRNA ligase [Candidatus Pacearchaeota archaeon]